MTDAELDALDHSDLLRRLRGSANFLDKAGFTGFPLIAKDCREAADSLEKQCNRKGHYKRILRETEAENAALRKQLKMQEEVLTGFFKVAMDRAEKAEQRVKELEAQPCREVGMTNWEAVAAEIAERLRISEADNAALRQDAERYRWLRDKSVPPHNFYISVPDEFKDVHYAPAQVDAAIDAALLAGKEVK